MGRNLFVDMTCSLWSLTALLHSDYSSSLVSLYRKMNIAVNENGKGVSSTSQAAAANLDCMPTVEDLYADLNKGGSSGSKAVPVKGTALILF